MILLSFRPLVKAAPKPLSRVSPSKGGRCGWSALQALYRRLYRTDCAKAGGSETAIGSEGLNAKACHLKRASSGNVAVKVVLKTVRAFLRLAGTSDARKAMDMADALEKLLGAGARV
ncbi:hypothetical protein ELI03_34650 [Rhizobium leguminosarum]|uniref:Uncharacterized protein n=1 Tax=Rhizobium leguminosarum TaxID=384 RepID=A0A4Q8XNQ0_RHILE|nr:hypothetical protein [Rhizobium leguminosarum]TAX64398.1 hypothetical protein ELI03_34650 [Rhizobium leguminosarum]